MASGFLSEPPLNPSGSVPVLLTSARFYGTLSAARCLGRLGAHVIVADSTRTGPASWSRFVARREVSPDELQPTDFLKWLLDFGKRSPRTFLYPTSDDLAWLLAKEREALSKYFYMYQPPVDCIYALLNKRRLFEICREVDVPAPLTWFPNSDADFDRLTRESAFPVLLKPQTQILNARHRKGEVVKTPSALRRQYQDFSREEYAPELMAYDPQVNQPMVQQLFADSDTRIYSISGFIDESGQLFSTRASRKVLQRPRRLGVGICFESEPVLPALADRIRRIARRVGYYGIFEVEFIEAHGEHLLIDFNPRYFGQMEFDVARGLPLPHLVYLAALGDGEGLRRLVGDANAQKDDRRAVYCNRLALETTLGLQRLSGALSAEEKATWRHWLDQHQENIIDAVIDLDDVAPAAIDTMQQMLLMARHPRSFVRTMVLNR